MSGLRVVANPHLGSAAEAAVTAPPKAELGFEQIVSALENLPVQRSAALAVVRALENPDANATTIARAAAADPTLATRLLRTANSAFFGLSGRVRDLPFAVTVLGTLTVRSLAAAAAADVVDGAVPAEFWLTSSRRATGAALVAPRVGCKPDDAFCAALLGELGFALVHRLDPDGHPLIVSAAGTAGECPLAAEHEHYGIDHSDAAARVLLAWKFPAELCNAVAHMHTGDASDEPLTRAVRAGACLAARLAGSVSHDPSDLSHERLAAAHVPPADIPELLETVEARSTTIAEALGSRAAAA